MVGGAVVRHPTDDGEAEQLAALSGDAGHHQQQQQQQQQQELQKVSSVSRW